MARLVIRATLILFLVATAVPGCTGKTTSTTTSPAPTTTTLAITSTGQSSSTGSNPSTTATAGQTWQEVVSRFTKSVTEANLAGTLPYSMLLEDEVAWLLSKDAPIHATSATGFRFANGDQVILFGGSPLVRPGSPQVSDASPIERALSDAGTALQKIAEARYQVSGKTVQATIFDLTFGFVVIAGEHAHELWVLALGAHV